MESTWPLESQDNSTPYYLLISPDFLLTRYYPQTATVALFMEVWVEEGRRVEELEDESLDITHDQLRCVIFKRNQWPSDKLNN